jgi:hypothetical protein
MTPELTKADDSFYQENQWLLGNDMGLGALVGCGTDLPFKLKDLLVMYFFLTVEHFHVFVGDISPDIESHQLREAFAPFGVIS